MSEQARSTSRTVDGLEDWVSCYYGHWPQHAAMSACAAMVVLGDGRPAVQIAGVALAPITVLSPAALPITSVFFDESDEHTDA